MNRRWLMELWVFAVLLVVAVASRLLQDVTPALPPNFHAVTAVTLFAGFYFARWTTALALPLLAMLVSDAIIGGYDGGVMVTVYATLGLGVAWRSVLRKRLNPVSLAAISLASSILFYATTNFAVWYVWAPAHTWATLIRCYAVALPFFKYTLCGDLAYTCGVFGAYLLARCYGLTGVRRSQPQAS